MADHEVRAMTRAGALQFGARSADHPGMEGLGILRLALLVAPLLVQSCATAPPPRAPEVIATHGTASYMAESLAGRRTASGAPFDPKKMVAAHRSVRFGTRLKVTNLANGRTAIVTVVDRGPFRKSRILDVSPRAARELGFHRQGLARVRIEVAGADETAGGDAR